MPTTTEWTTISVSYTHLDVYKRQVLGGTHLVEADGARIDKTVKAMKEMGVHIIGFSHCSGEKAECEVKSDTNVKSCHLGTGDCFAID